MKICCCIIYYDNAEEIRAYLHSLSSQSARSCIDVVMTVNKGQPSDASELQAYAGQLGLSTYVYTPKQNLGYLNGFLFGYNAYVEQTGNVPDWTMLSNTDISFCGNNFFDPFLQSAYEPDVGVVGPSIFNPALQEYQSPHCLTRRSKRSMQLHILFFSIPILSNLYIWLADSRFKSRVTEAPESTYAYEVNGAFIAFSKMFMEYFSKQHYGMLLYGEEVFIAEHARLAAMRTYYDAGISLLHNEHGSTSHINTSQMARLVRRNLRYNLHEFY